MFSSVLFIDDDPRLLDSFKRSLSREFNVFVADSPEKGLRMVAESGPFSVIVSDMRMPGMNGIEVFDRVQEINRDIVRILLTGYADQQTAIDAVNRGQVFRFLTKPCEVDGLISVLREGIGLYQRTVAEKGLRGATLNGVVNLLAQVLSLVNPVAQAKANRLKRYCRYLAAGCDPTERWTVESAALLSQLGDLTGAPGASARSAVDNGQEDSARQLLNPSTELAARLLMHVPAFEDIIEILLLQGKPIAAWPHPATTDRQRSLHRCGHILQAAIRMDSLLFSGMDPDAALASMRGEPELYAPALLDLFAAYDFGQQNMVPLHVRCGDLSTRMILNEDIYAADGSLVACKHEPVTPVLLAELRACARDVGIREPLAVLAPLTSLPHGRSNS